MYATAHICLAITAFGVSGIAMSAIVISFWTYVIGQNCWRWALDVVIGIFLFVCVAATLIPALGKIRESALISECRSNLKQIALDIRAYREIHGNFPPEYISDKDGNPIHSWRVLILAQTEYKSIYNQYDFAETWNGPNNRKLIPHMPGIYRCPSSDRQSGETNYFVVAGSACYPEDGRQDSLGDKSLLLIESQRADVAWSEPRDLTREEALAALTAPTSPACHVEETFFTYEEIGFNVALVDSSAHTMVTPLSVDEAAALLSEDGFDLSSIDALSRVFRPRRLRWSRIISCSLLLLLTLWPFRYSWRNGARISNGSEFNSGELRARLMVLARAGGAGC